MSVLKLISQGKAYDELFDTADYIQTDDGVGIYPAYENLLRDNINNVNVVSMNATEGYFIINVPSVSSSAEFKIDNLDLVFEKEYTAYFETSVKLDSIKGGTLTTPDAWFTTTTLSGVVDFEITENKDSFFKFFPNTADKDTDILVKYTIVPINYPLLQEWAGSQLSATLSGTEKSYSFKFLEWNSTSSIGYSIPFRIKSLNYNRITVRKVSNGVPRVELYTENLGTGAVIYDMDKDATMTVSMSGKFLSLYENGIYVLGTLVDWIEKPTQIITNANIHISYDLKSLFVSTEESTGYSQNSEPSIQPTCKLGLSGAEIDLPKESRIQSSGNRVVKELESESANATLHTQFIATKERRTISYDVISEKNKKAVLDIIALQQSNNARLNYIYNEESGNLVTITGKASEVTGGNRIIRDRYYDGGMTIEIKES